MFLIGQTKDIEYNEPDDLRNWLYAKYVGPLSAFNVALKVMIIILRTVEEGYVPNYSYNLNETNIRKSVPKYLKAYTLAELQPHIVNLYFGHSSLSTVCRIRVSRGLNIENLAWKSHSIDLHIHVTKTNEELKTPSD
ncbi:MAG: hypothetical protein APF81_06490 [Desulfosporosinus sp. BRH_c37]|nr:MAG: hypothetical protein APF81_06490 [Desulfosporosinus sp. BRH_c37]